MFKKKTEKNGSETASRPVWRDGHLKMEPWAFVPTENPLRVHISAVREDLPIIPAEGYKETKLEAALHAVEEVKKVYPDAEISIEVEV